jgi:hypothetical protein
MNTGKPWSAFLPTVCMAFVAFAMLATNAIAADPVVRLKFDDNLDDSGTAGIAGITVGPHSTFSNTTLPPTISTGKAMRFSPTADNDPLAAVTIPDNPALNFGSFTMTTWFKPDGSIGKAGLGTNLYSRYVSAGAASQGFFIGTSWSSIIDINDSSARNLRLIVNIDNASFFTDSIVTGSNNFSNSPVIHLITDWIFVAFSYDATTSTGKTYFGVNSDPSALTGAMAGTVFGTVHAPEAPSSALNGNVGLRFDGNRALEGRLDDFRFYGTALSAAEVEAVRLSTLPLVGDYNNNGLVDAADYVAWRRTLGQSVTAGTGADGNGDGQITQADYDVWRANFGQSAGSGATLGAGAAVPEPATMVLALVGWGAIGVRGARRRISTT